MILNRLLHGIFHIAQVQTPDYVSGVIWEFRAEIEGDMENAMLWVQYDTLLPSFLCLSMTDRCTRPCMSWVNRNTQRKLSSPVKFRVSLNKFIQLFCTQVYDFVKCMLIYSIFLKKNLRLNYYIMECSG